MKKFFECIGMITLVCFSFFVTEKTAGVVKEMDDIMIEIKKAEKNHQINSIDAILEQQTIIPGIYGKKVDIKKSYDKMKRVGNYQENLLVYKKERPKISSEKQYDKYIISGNPKKNMVSLIFLVNNNTNLSKIEKIIDQKNIKVNFFVDGTWFEKNNNQALNWIENDHIVGNLNSEDENSTWMDTMIKNLGKQKEGFCYTTKPNKNILNTCKKNRDYTIIPNIIVQTNPLSEIKKTLSSGSIIALPVNDIVEKELPIIINYIHGKGYTIENLYHHLNELEPY